jgi:hypothetical protein
MLREDDVVDRSWVDASSRYQSADDESAKLLCSHVPQYPSVPADWRPDGLAYHCITHADPSEV